ncbi:MAG: c-type cytochrome [Saprospiraceae bacterium]|nr:c-type cytochrome [Saprospiraceae bacterium]
MKWVPISIFSFVLSCQLSTEPYKEGKFIYDKQCSNCHGINFEGLAKLYPAFEANKLSDFNRRKLVCLVKHGSLVNDTTNLNSVMPSFEKLSEIQICNVLNYIFEKHQISPMFDLEEIRLLLLECKD